MTAPVASARPKTARHLVALAAAGVLAAVSPVALAAPAAAGAAESTGCPDGFGATAASNTLAVGGLDLRPLGVDQPPLPELRAATAHSGFAGGPARAAGDARYIQSSGVLPPGLIGPSAYQQAPPPNQDPATVPVDGVNIGALATGAGSLRAHATWQDAAKCTEAAGPRATADARLAGLAILPARGGRALLRFGAIQAGTSTGVAQKGGKPAATATANGGIADFTLLPGSASAIGVHVLSAPSLSVAAGAKKTVDFTSPVLEVHVAGRDAIRVDSAGSHADIVVPVDAGSRGAAEDLARSEGLPAASGTSLLDLLGGATAGLSGTVAGTRAVPESLLSSLLPGLPAVGGGESTVHATEGVHARPARVVILRVEIGTVSKQTSPTGLYAKASAIRVKLILRTSWKSTGDSGYGGTGNAGAGEQQDRTTILDLGVCSLEAAAATPAGGGYGGGAGGGYGGVQGGGDTLPVTGPAAFVVLGAGLLLLVAGRLFVVLSRRRSAA